MEECNICLTKIKKQNKNKHGRSKKHKHFFSNLILKKYVKNDEIDKFNDILQSYHDEHTKKINQFRIDIVWKKTM